MPSNAAELSAVQRGVLTKLDNLSTKLVSGEGTFLDFCQEFMETGALSARETAKTILAKIGLPGFEVEAKINNTKTPPAPGTYTTTILQWRFDEASMWRGAPKNHMVLKYAKSIASTRFRPDPTCEMWVHMCYPHVPNAMEVSAKMHINHVYWWG